MVVRSEPRYGGVDLQVGDTLEGHYSLKIDESAEELYNEFLDYESDAAIEEAAAEFIEEKIPHIYDLAEEKGLDPESLDQKRRKAQKKGSKVSISKVLDGAWENTAAGTCRERAAALKLLYDELSLNAKYKSGSIEEGRQDGHAWVGLNEDMIADPAANPKVFQEDRAPHQTGTAIVRRSF
ncbi:MAG: hypothetical protein R6V35_00960 [Candidatus Nanohaloarchaea archaeon]